MTSGFGARQAGSQVFPGPPGPFSCVRLPRRAGPAPLMVWQQKVSIVAEVDETTCPRSRNEALTWRAFAGPASGRKKKLRGAANGHDPAV